MIHHFVLALALAVWGSLSAAATLSIQEAQMGDFPDAVGASNPIVGQLDAGANMISGRLSGDCTPTYGFVDCNWHTRDGQDSFAVAVPDHLFLDHSRLVWTGTAPDGFRLVMSVRDLSNGASRLIGAPLGYATLSGIPIRGGPAHLSVIAGSAAATGPYDVTWQMAVNASVPLPASLSLAMTALAALLLTKRSASARRRAIATR